MKRLFSVLMVAAIATFTFAFTTPKVGSPVSYHFTNPGWENGAGLGCDDGNTLCDITFDDDFIDFADDIKAEVQNANAGAGMTAGPHVIQTDDGPVTVTVTRKNVAK